MKKKVKFIVFVVSIFMSNFATVFAKTFEGSYLPVCISDNSCLLACEYENNYEEKKEKLAIFYDYSSKKMRVVFTTDGYNQRTFYDLDNKNVFYEKELFNADNSSCPEYAFINESGINELCFSTSKNYCLDISGTLGFGKKFEGNSERTYNFADQISLYYNDVDNYFYDVSCENFDLSTLENKLINDFNKNFLNGNNLPSFIENNDTFQELNQKQADKIKKYVNKCKDSITNNQELDDESKKSALQKFDYSDEDISEMLESVNYKMKNYDKLDYKKASEINCEALLGSVTNPDEPAYYISMAFNIIKYLSTLILIVFTIVDYIKAVVSKDDEELSKTNTRFVKRFIFAIIIFVLPSLIIMVLEWGGLINDPSICGI